MGDDMRERMDLRRREQFEKFTMALAEVGGLGSRRLVLR